MRRLIRALPRFDPRRRLRHRLLASMLVVALLPLAIFTLLVAVDLGSMSRATTEETHQTIVDDQRSRLHGQVVDRANSIDSRLSGLADEVRSVRDVLIDEEVNPQPVAGTFEADRGVKFRAGPNSGMALLVGTSTTNAAPVSVRAARLGDPGGRLAALMAQVRGRHPEVESVWASDLSGIALLAVPGFDLHLALDATRITPDAPQGRSQEAVLNLSRSRMAASTGTPGAWPRAAGGTGNGPFWTDPYPLRSSGGQGITVWMPLADGTLRVGFDILLKPLTDLLLQGQVSGEPGAYPLLLSSSNMVLATSDAASPDFGATAPAVGGLLPLPPTNRALVDGITGMERAGRAQVVEATLTNTPKLLFAADVDAPHWMLVTSVPRADLEPDLVGLTKGIDQGIRRIFLQAIPIAGVLVLFATLLATLFARRIVHPVRALTTSAERLTEGHTDEAVPPQGSDEVGILAASLERMRREINSSRDAILAASRELEHRVADRTVELRARNEELLALNALAGSLTRSLDPPALLAGGLDAVRAVLPVHTGQGFVLDGDQLVAVTPVDAGVRGLESIAARAIAERHMVTHGTRDGLLIGLVTGTSRGALGGLGLLARRAPNGDTAVLLNAIANQVGLALRTARLSAEGREMAVLQERTRLAREIHDTLAQQLTGIVLQLEAAQAFVDRDPQRATSTVAQARELARAALREARRSVWDLRPEPLDTSSGVVAAVGREVGRFGERTGITARMRAEHMRPPPPLSPQAEVTLLRITQQALTNIADHSGATRVTVRLRRDGDTVELSVHDNGCGFDADEPRSGAFGVIGMAERARLAGGDFALESQVGRGTTVIARLPCAGERVRVPA